VSLNASTKLLFQIHWLYSSGWKRPAQGQRWLMSLACLLTSRCVESYCLCILVLFSLPCSLFLYEFFCPYLAILWRRRFSRESLQDGDDRADGASSFIISWLQRKKSLTNQSSQLVTCLWLSLPLLTHGEASSFWYTLRTFLPLSVKLPLLIFSSLFLA